MLSKFKIIFFGCSMLLFSCVLSAETSPQDQQVNTVAQSNTPQSASSQSMSRIINLRQAISKTFAHNPALKSFSYELKAQQGRERQAV